MLLMLFHGSLLGQVQYKKTRKKEYHQSWCHGIRNTISVIPHHLEIKLGPGGQRKYWRVELYNHQIICLLNALST